MSDIPGRPPNIVYQTSDGKITISLTDASDLTVLNDKERTIAIAMCNLAIGRLTSAGVWS